MIVWPGIEQYRPIAIWVATTPPIWMLQVRTSFIRMQNGIITSGSGVELPASGVRLQLAAPSISTSRHLLSAIISAQRAKQAVNFVFNWFLQDPSLLIDFRIAPGFLEVLVDSFAECFIYSLLFLFLGAECFERVRSGYRLDERIVRDSFYARGIYECESECQRSRTFICRSFSYRFVSISIPKWIRLLFFSVTLPGFFHHFQPILLESLLDLIRLLNTNLHIQIRLGLHSALNYNRNINNCFLSDIAVRNMDPVRHLAADRDTHIYERNALIQSCRHPAAAAAALVPWTSQQQPVQSSAGKFAFMSN